jgi:uncharacterized protein (DUF58 family)
MVDLPILLIVLIVVAVLLRLDFIFYLVYVGVGTYALARWWTGRNLPRLNIKRHFADHAFLGQTVPVDIVIENTSWWPIPWLRFDETLSANLATGRPMRQVIALRPHERLTLHYDIVGWHRGYYDLGPAMLATGDLFGFAETRGRLADPDHLTVYPRVIPLARLDLQSRSPYGTVKSRERIFADPARVAGKRDYQPGDALHDIDWKSSAHGATLQVKKYDPAVSLTTMVFVNLNKAEYSPQRSYEASEWGIELAASLANYLIAQRQAVGLASNGKDPLTDAQPWLIPARSGRVHLMKLLEWLARVQSIDTSPLAEWLPAAALDLAWGTTVIVIDPAGSEATCRSLHQLVRNGLNPMLIVTEPQFQFATVRERARRLGFAAHLMTGEHDLKRWKVTH